MAVSIDTVYQKVLTLANKEKRGYITPQEFNLLADKAQLEIIDSYFHQMKVSYYKPTNQTEAFDEYDMLRQKMNHIRTQKEVSLSGFDYGWNTGDRRLWSNKQINHMTTHLPKALLIGSVYLLPAVPGEDSTTEEEEIYNMTLVEEVDRHELIEMFSNPLTVPTKDRPVYVSEFLSATASATLSPSGAGEIRIMIYPKILQGSDLPRLLVEYWEKPPKPKWNYVVVNKKPLYNFTTSMNFKLHPIEEENLVMRILQLAGIVIEKQDLQQAAHGLEQKNHQMKNS